MQDVFENVQIQHSSDRMLFSNFLFKYFYQNIIGTGRTMFLGPKYLHLIKQISRRRLNLLVISLDNDGFETTERRDVVA